MPNPPKTKTHITSVIQKKNDGLNLRAGRGSGGRCGHGAPRPDPLRPPGRVRRVPSSPAESEPSTPVLRPTQA